MERAMAKERPAMQEPAMRIFLQDSTCPSEGMMIEAPREQRKKIAVTLRTFSINRDIDALRPLRQSGIFKTKWNTDNLIPA